LTVKNGLNGYVFARSVKTTHDHFHYLSHSVSVVGWLFVFPSCSCPSYVLVLMPPFGLFHGSQWATAALFSGQSGHLQWVLQWAASQTSGQVNLPIRPEVLCLPGQDTSECILGTGMDLLLVFSISYSSIHAVKHTLPLLVILWNDILRPMNAASVSFYWVWFAPLIRAILDYERVTNFIYVCMYVFVKVTYFAVTDAADPTHRSNWIEGRRYFENTGLFDSRKG